MNNDILTTDLIRRTYDFAARAHEGQIRRDTGLPYISHPLNVARNVVNYYHPLPNGLTTELLIQVALLHDTLEDTSVTEDDILANFGEEVLQLVKQLTTDKIECDKMGKTAYLSAKMGSMNKDALFVKFCDRLDNLHDYLTSVKKGKSSLHAQKYAQSTLEILNNISRFEYPLLQTEIKSTCNDIFYHAFSNTSFSSFSKV
uniref:HD domain-containing protein n=1 Tax=viral metagenome TaxID=1070528 RepID=A0A6C0JRT9_9ZZZZ